MQSTVGGASIKRTEGAGLDLKGSAVAKRDYIGVERTPRHHGWGHEEGSKHSRFVHQVPSSDTANGLAGKRNPTFATDAVFIGRGLVWTYCKRAGAAITQGRTYIMSDLEGAKIDQ